MSGTVYSGGRFFAGYVEFDQGTIISVSEGKLRGKSSAQGIIIPYLADCHTHIGDACLRGKIEPGISLERLVRPPNGLKHMLLAQQSDDDVVTGMGAAIDEMRYFGVGRFMDFREGGLKGLGLLKRAISDHPYPLPIVLSRPAGLSFSEDEVDELLEGSDGIGVSAARDWPMDDLAHLSDRVRRKGKIFALHASEGVREDIAKILDLKPNFLVHMASATEEDLIACRDANVPIIVCPRSNSRFGIKLDMAKMIDLGLEVCIGTDNAMLNDMSVIDELRAACYLRSNSRRLDPIEAFKLAIDNPRKVLNDKGVITISAGNPCEFMLVRAGMKDSPEELLRPGTEYMIEFVCRGSRIWKSTPWKRSRGY